VGRLGDIIHLLFTATTDGSEGGDTVRHNTGIRIQIQYLEALSSVKVGYQNDIPTAKLPIKTPHALASVGIPMHHTLLISR
jgi:hypothetical protein